MVKTKKLIVFGGLSCAGKSYWIDLLKSGQAYVLADQLGMSGPTDWRFINVRRLRDKKLPAIIDKLVVHYDFYADYKNKEFRYLKELVDQSDQVIFVTLCVPSVILVGRLKKRILGLFKSLFYSGRAYRQLPERVYRLAVKLYRYKDKKTVPDLYRRWYEFLQESNISQSWLLDAREGVQPELIEARTEEYLRLIKGCKM